MPLPLEAYVDAWHGPEAVHWIEEYDRAEPFFLFVGFPGPHDPWDAPVEAVDATRLEISMPASTPRPIVEGTGYGELLNSFFWVSDSETMTDDAIRGMRRSYAADSRSSTTPWALLVADMYFESPLYCAPNVCVPSVRPETVNEATPDEFRLTAGWAVPSTLNVTDPVGTLTPP